MRTLLALLVALLIAFGLVWFLAGRAAGPAITLGAPTTVVGQRDAADSWTSMPRAARVTALDVSLEQSGQPLPLGLAGAAAGPQVRDRRRTG